MNHSHIHLGFCNESFKPGTHMCLIFRNEAERRRIAARFIESGFLDGEKVGYFADTATVDDVKEWLASMDVDITRAEEEALLSIDPALDVYCPDGTFVPDRMLDTLRSTWNDSVSQGYPNVRVSGEMSWALQGLPGSDRLIEYEARVNQVVESHPVTAMCQYDANKFSGSLIYQALQVHPWMVVNGQVVENPYYLKGYVPA